MDGTRLEQVESHIVSGKHVYGSTVSRLVNVASQ